jgi:hypothetical protein
MKTVPRSVIVLLLSSIGYDFVNSVITPPDFELLQLNSSAQLWNEYMTLFPKELPLIYRSAETLEEAHRQQQVENSSTNRSAYQVGCTTYTHGGYVADNFRGTGLQPLLVDELTDQMCFTTAGMPSAVLAGAVASLLDFATPVSSAIKVHPSLYELVQSSDEELLDIIHNDQSNNWHLSAHFTPITPEPSIDVLLQDITEAAFAAEAGEATAEEEAAEATSFPNLIAEAISPFVKFFWSSVATQSFFSTADLSDPLLLQGNPTHSIHDVVDESLTD